ncbi:hypothetical protein [Salinispora tropica]|uniref:Uncharacterized protein n=1 Tax=Salinispora tropica (strain ATCC BAA-916 / DSM 44818 / JCM 13857 / NBRC 105044 / CNB-440) TaxID=369723 RepID=A4X819_SALTO|nr:hypothetical protein [Salinispora tropica]ABP55019.1 hypothetical protein Strop_2575 [Salinispora tropica CNB-440]
MTAPPPPPPPPPTDAAAAPQWLQVVLSVLGVLGGAGGLATIAAVVVKRGKFRAEAADVLTDTALTLVQPMRTRVAELEAEAQTIREQLRASNERSRRLQARITQLRTTLDRWYAMIVTPDASLESIRYTVREDRRQLRTSGEVQTEPTGDR